MTCQKALNNTCIFFFRQSAFDPTISSEANGSLHLQNRQTHKIFRQQWNILGIQLFLSLPLFPLVQFVPICSNVCQIFPFLCNFIAKAERHRAAQGSFSFPICWRPSGRNSKSRRLQTVSQLLATSGNVNTI